MLADGASLRDLEFALKEGGLGAQGQESVRGLIGEWLTLGYFLPEAVCSMRRGTPQASLRLQIDDVAFTVNVFGAATARRIQDVFGSLAGGAGGEEFTVVNDGDLDFLFVGDVPLGASNPADAPAKLKAELTARYAATARRGFLAHAALVVRDGASILICGSPGAGKTTLALALTSVGYSFVSDDIVRVDEQGKLFGASFAAAVKPGSWPLLSPLWPVLERLPSITRPDGQRVRYVTPDHAAGGPFEFGTVLLLDRRPRSSARLLPVPEEEALASLLSSGYSQAHRIEAETLEAVARAVSRAACFRFQYDDLQEAVRVLMSHSHE